MENVAEALKIAFVIFVFILAITITFSSISQAKTTSDAVFYHSDKTNFYQHSISSETNRNVTVAEVISTLYRYYKESIAVTIDLEDNQPKTFDLANNSYSTVNKIEEELADEVMTLLSDNYANKVFKEQFVEVPYSGIYDIAEDGTEIVKSSGGKKVYVTYTLENSPSP